MSDAPIVHDTFVLDRLYPKPVETVFAALADPAKKRRWYAEEGTHEVVAFEMDFRPGGVERTHYRMGANTPFPGTPLETEGRHEVIVDNRRIVISSTMKLGGRPISTALVSFELEEAGDGTRLAFTHQAAFYEGADGPEMRRGGWEALLGQLGSFLAA